MFWYRHMNNFANTKVEHTEIISEYFWNMFDVLVIINNLHCSNECMVLVFLMLNYVRRDFVFAGLLKTDCLVIVRENDGVDGTRRIGLKVSFHQPRFPIHSIVQQHLSSWHQPPYGTDLIPAEASEVVSWDCRISLLWRLAYRICPRGSMPVLLLSSRRT